MFKKFLKLFTSYKVQMISMIIMMAIACGVFVGFTIEWYSIDVLTNEQFEENKFPDYKVYSTDVDFSRPETILTNYQVEIVDNIEEVQKAVGHFQDNCNVIKFNDKDISKKNKSLSLNTMSSYEINTLSIVKGISPDEDNDGNWDDNLSGCWVNEHFLEENKLNIGDKISINYNGITNELEILGGVRSANFYITADFESGQIMPRYNMYGFVYVTPETMKLFYDDEIKTKLNYFGVDNYFTQIDLLSDTSKEKLTNIIEDKLGITLLVQAKADDVGYSESMGEVTEGKLCATIIAVLFLVIMVLSLFTTLDRIIRTERIQIGTFKALGFKNRKICLVYSSIGLSIGLIGAILGIGIGYFLGWFIMNPNGSMGTYIDPVSWSLHCPIFVWFVLIGIILIITLISYIFIRLSLVGSAASLLKPKAPKHDKPLLIERFKLFNKLSFTSRWNIRDIFRHKVRSFMTLFGIFSATLLLFVGFGMKDTINGLLDSFSEVYDYKEQIIINTSKATNEDVIDMASYYEADYQAVTSIDIKGNDYTLTILNTSYNHMHLLDDDSNRMDLDEDKEGVYICYRMYNDGYKKGDTIKFSPYGTNDIYEVKVIGVNRTFLSEGITASAKFINSLRSDKGNLIEYKIQNLYTDKYNELAKLDQYEAIIQSVQTYAQTFESMNGMMEVLNEMIWMIVIAAVIIGLVVLYNLGIMSFIERQREFATLKVVGFKNKSLGKIMIMQNIWLTIIGIVISLPLSYLILSQVMSLIGAEYEMTIYTGWLTYVGSVVITFIVSMLVALLVIRKTKKISMVEALKGNE